MPRTRVIFAIVKRVRGPKKGSTYKRYFKSNLEKTSTLARYRKLQGLPSKVEEAHRVVKFKEARKALVAGGKSKREATRLLKKYMW